MSPYKVLMGREPITPLERKQPNDSHGVQSRHKEVIENALQAKTNQAKYYNQDKSNRVLSAPSPKDTNLEDPLKTPFKSREVIPRGQDTYAEPQAQGIPWSES